MNSDFTFHSSLTTIPLSILNLIIPNIFLLIGESYEFYKKQPACNAVLLWLFTLPLTLLMLIGHLQEHHPALQAMREPIVWGVTDLRPILVLFVIQIVLSLILIWGIACTLLIGKRMLTSRAGRSRTSFAAVRKEGGWYVLPLFVTGILRDCLTILWAFLLILPGILYYIRTILYHVAVVCEGQEYRRALKRSKEIVSGHTWTVFEYFLGLTVVLFVPPLFIAGNITRATMAFDPRLVPATYIIESFLLAFAILLYLLSTIALYRELKKLPAPIHGTLTR